MINVKFDDDTFNIEWEMKLYLCFCVNNLLNCLYFSEIQNSMLLIGRILQFINYWKGLKLLHVATQQREGQTSSPCVHIVLHAWRVRV
jgi:hypothetical protein